MMLHLTGGGRIEPSRLTAIVFKTPVSGALTLGDSAGVADEY